MSTEVRTRFLDAGIELFRRQGYAATPVKQLVDQGGAPMGSLYHYFPQGKQQIALQAIEHAAERYETLLDRVFARCPDIGDAATTWFRMAADALRKSDYQDGCPIGTLVSEVAATHDELRIAGQQVLESWQQRVAERLIELGVPRATAQHHATFAVAALEGAILLGRVQRSTMPLTNTGRIVADTLCAAING